MSGVIDFFKKKKKLALISLIFVIILAVSLVFIPQLASKAVNLDSTQDFITGILKSAEIPHDTDVSSSEQRTKNAYINFAGSEYWVVSAANNCNYQGYRATSTTLYAKKGYLYYPFFRNNNESDTKNSTVTRDNAEYLSVSYSKSDVRAYLTGNEAWLKDSNKQDNSDATGVGGYYLSNMTGRNSSAQYTTPRLYDGTKATTFENDFMQGRDVDLASIVGTCIETNIYDSSKHSYETSKDYDSFFLPDVHADEGDDCNNATKKVISVGPGSISDYDTYKKESKGSADAWYSDYVTARTNNYFIPSNYWTLSSIPSVVSNSGSEYGLNYASSALTRAWSWALDKGETRNDFSLFKSQITTIYADNNTSVAKSWWSGTANAQLITPACNLDTSKIKYITLRNDSGEEKTSFYKGEDLDTALQSYNKITLMLEDDTKSKSYVRSVVCSDNKISMDIQLNDTDKKVGCILEDNNGNSAIVFEGEEKVKYEDGLYVVDLNNVIGLNIEQAGGSSEKGGNFKIQPFIYTENTEGVYGGSNDVYDSSMSVDNYLIRYSQTLGNVLEVVNKADAYIDNLTGTCMVYETNSASTGTDQAFYMDEGFSSKTTTYEKQFGWECDEAQLCVSFDNEKFDVTLTYDPGYMNYKGTNWQCKKFEQTLESGTQSNIEYKSYDGDRSSGYTDDYHWRDGENKYTITVTPKDKYKDYYNEATYTFIADVNSLAALDSLYVSQTQSEASEDSLLKTDFDKYEIEYPQYETKDIASDESEVSIKALLKDSTGTETGTITCEYGDYTVVMSNGEWNTIGNLDYGVNRLYIHTSISENDKSDACEYEYTDDYYIIDVTRQLPSPEITPDTENTCNPVTVSISAPSGFYSDGNIQVLYALNEYNAKASSKNLASDTDVYTSSFELATSKKIVAQLYMQELVSNKLYPNAGYTVKHVYSARVEQKIKYVGKENLIPAVSKESGTYYGDIDIAFNVNDTVDGEQVPDDIAFTEIHYTTDSSEPNRQSPAYVQGQMITLKKADYKAKGNQVTLKAIAYNQKGDSVKLDPCTYVFDDLKISLSKDEGKYAYESFIYLDEESEVKGLNDIRVTVTNSKGEEIGSDEDLKVKYTVSTAETGGELPSRTSGETYSYDDTEQSGEIPSQNGIVLVYDSIQKSVQYVKVVAYLDDYQNSETEIKSAKYEFVDIDNKLDIKYGLEDGEKTEIDYKKTITVYATDVNLYLEKTGSETNYNIKYYYGADDPKEEKDYKVCTETSIKIPVTDNSVTKSGKLIACLCSADGKTELEKITVNVKIESTLPVPKIYNTTDGGEIIFNENSGVYEPEHIFYYVDGEDLKVKIKNTDSRAEMSYNGFSTKTDMYIDVARNIETEGERATSVPITINCDGQEKTYTYKFKFALIDGAMPKLKMSVDGTDYDGKATATCFKDTALIDFKFAESESKVTSSDLEIYYSVGEETTEKKYSGKFYINECDVDGSTTIYCKIKDKRDNYVTKSLFYGINFRTVSLPTLTNSSGTKMPSGHYYGQQTLKFQGADSDAKIYYTLDGSDPKTNILNRKEYDDTQGIVLTENKSTQVLRYISVKTYASEEVFSKYGIAKYKISAGLEKPDLGEYAAEDGKFYYDSFIVKVNKNEDYSDCKLMYQITGTAKQTEGWKEYYDGIYLDRGDKTSNTKAILEVKYVQKGKEGEAIESEVAKETYQFSQLEIKNNPTASINGTELTTKSNTVYYSDQKVKLSATFTDISDREKNDVKIVYLIDSPYAADSDLTNLKNDIANRGKSVTNGEEITIKNVNKDVILSMYTTVGSYSVPEAYSKVEGTIVNINLKFGTLPTVMTETKQQTHYNDIDVKLKVTGSDLDVEGSSSYKIYYTLAGSEDGTAEAEDPCTSVSVKEYDNAIPLKWDDYKNKVVNIKAVVGLKDSGSDQIVYGKVSSFRYKISEINDIELNLQDNAICFSDTDLEIKNITDYMSDTISIRYDYATNTAATDTDTSVTTNTDYDKNTNKIKLDKEAGASKAHQVTYKIISLDNGKTISKKDKVINCLVADEKMDKPTISEVTRTDISKTIGISMQPEKWSKFYEANDVRLRYAVSDSDKQAASSDYMDYTSPFIISTDKDKDVKVWAYASYDFKENGKVADKIISMNTLTEPVATPGSGGYYSSPSITLSTQSNVTIYYTMDGSDPRTSETKKIYESVAIKFDQFEKNNDYILKAVACEVDSSGSVLHYGAVAEYRYNALELEAPTASIADGVYYEDSANDFKFNLISPYLTASGNNIKLEYAVLKTKDATPTDKSWKDYDDEQGIKGTTSGDFYYTFRSSTNDGQVHSNVTKAAYTICTREDFEDVKFTNDGTDTNVEKKKIFLTCGSNNVMIKYIITKEKLDDKTAYDRVKSGGNVCSSGSYIEVNRESTVMYIYALPYGYKSSGELSYAKSHSNHSVSFSYVANPIPTLTQGSYYDKQNIGFYMENADANVKIQYIKSATVTDLDDRNDWLEYNNLPFELSANDPNICLKIRAVYTDPNDRTIQQSSETKKYEYYYTPVEAPEASIGSKSSAVNIYGATKVSLKSGNSVEQFDKNGYKLVVRYKLTNDNDYVVTSTDEIYENGSEIIVKKLEEADSGVCLKVKAYLYLKDEVIETANPLKESEQANYLYNFVKPEAPTADKPAEDVNYADINVILKSPTECVQQIHYKIDDAEGSPIENGGSILVQPKDLSSESPKSEIKVTAWAVYKDAEDKENASEEYTISYTFKNPDTPIISPDGEALYDDVAVTIVEDAISDAEKQQTKVFYTTDGSQPAFDNGEPNKTTYEYVGPFTIKASEHCGETVTITAVRVSSDKKYTSSPSIKAYYFNKLPNVDVDTKNTVIYSETNVTFTVSESVSSETDMEIYYTYQTYNSKDTSEPGIGQSDTLKAKVGDTILVKANEGETKVIKARAYYNGSVGDVSTFTYTGGAIITPTISTKAGADSAESHQIVITHPNPQAKIYYTITGEDPTMQSSQLYKDPFNVERADCPGGVIKAMAFLDGRSSTVVKKEITFTGGDYWLQENNSKWRYYVNGEPLVEQFKDDIPGWGESKFYFDKEGYMAQGWQKIGQDWYYFDSSGVMQTGWKRNIPGYDRWLYFDSDGKMKVGWLYTIEGNGSPQGLWYYLYDENSFSEHWGWQYIDGNWCYLQPDWGGALLVDSTTPDGYVVDQNGYLKVQ